METPEIRDPVGAGTQHQMVGVAKDALGPGRADGIGGHRFDRCGGADRHKRGGFDRTVGSLKQTGPGSPIRGQRLKAVFREPFVGV